MNIHLTTPDLLTTFRSLKTEDQIDLIEYMKSRYNSNKVTDRYRKKALSQIRTALKVEFK